MKMKRLLSIIIAVMIYFISASVDFTNVYAVETEEIAVWDGSADTSWYDSEEAELHISTAEELAGMAQLVNSGKTMEGQTIYLENDIYLNDVTNFENWDEEIPENSWLQMGNYTEDDGNFFSGTFDGRQHNIYGIYINDKVTLYPKYTTKNIGFFRGCYGKIMNLSLKHEYIKVEKNGMKDALNVGGILGICRNGEIFNCSVEGKIVTIGYASTQGSSITRSGGICGSNNGGTIKKCKNKANLIIYDKAVRFNWNDYSCAAYGGGICGNICNSGVIDKCQNSGDITAIGEDNGSYSEAYAGGICASMVYGGSIINCYNKGKITTNKSAAGIICCINNSALDSTAIQNVYNIGDIDTESFSYGIVDYMDNEYMIENAYYLSDTSIKGVGTGIDTAISKNSANMKKEVFAKSLGCEFAYVEDDFPKLIWEVDFTVVNLNQENVDFNEYNQQTSLELMTNYTGVPVWISSDKNVATVENGTITAKNNGECIIYAICGDMRAACNVTVNYGYTLNKTNIEINEDETTELSVISDNTKSEAEGFEIVWTSSDENVVTVENGVIKAVSGGTAMVTASFGDVSLECKAIVNALIPEPKLNITSLELHEGETKELTVNNYTENITWISNNTEVAKVENGIVKAISPGNANIYAMLSDGTNLACAVTVNEAKVTSIITTNVTTVGTTTVTTVTQTTQTKIVTSIATTMPSPTTNITTTPSLTSENNGDVNDDGKFNISDVIMLQKWLVGTGELADWKAGDLCEDNIINVFDLCMMKRKLIEMK